MKAKVHKLEENGKNKNIREVFKGIHQFKKDYGKGLRAFMNLKRTINLAPM